MKVTPKNARKLIKLLEEWTRLEIIARLMPSEETSRLFPTSHPFMEKIDREDDIRKLLFGSDDLVTLGLEWGILKPYTKKKKKKLNKASKELLARFDDPPEKKKKKGKKKKKASLFE